MPQMAPLNWLMLFLFFLMIFILFNILNYFCFFNKFMNNTQTFNFSKKKTKPLSWNW